MKNEPNVVPKYNPVKCKKCNAALDRIPRPSFNEINNDISLQLLQKKGKDRGEDLDLGYGGPKIGR